MSNLFSQDRDCIVIQDYVSRSKICHWIMKVADAE